MKKPVWMSVALCGLLWGCQSAVPGAEWESLSTASSAMQVLPPVLEYPDPTGAQLPTGSYSHLVMGRCGDDGRFMAEAVNAPQGLIVARWVGYDAVASSRFLTEALGLGVPLIIYTEPVMLGEAPSAGGGTEVLPAYEPCWITIAGDPSDDPPGESNPTGNDPPDESTWGLFSEIAIGSAQALGAVTSPPPPPLPPPPPPQ